MYCLFVLPEHILILQVGAAAIVARNFGQGIADAPSNVFDIEGRGRQCPTVEALEGQPLLKLIDAIECSRVGFPVIEDWGLVGGGHPELMELGTLGAVNDPVIAFLSVDDLLAFVLPLSNQKTDLALNADGEDVATEPLRTVLEGTSWRGYATALRSPDIPEGSFVRVVVADGAAFAYVEDGVEVVVLGQGDSELLRGERGPLLSWLWTKDLAVLGSVDGECCMPVEGTQIREGLRGRPQRGLHTQ